MFIYQFVIYIYIYLYLYHQNIIIHCFRRSCPHAASVLGLGLLLCKIKEKGLKTPSFTQLLDPWTLLDSEKIAAILSSEDCAIFVPLVDRFSIRHCQIWSIILVTSNSLRVGGKSFI